MKTVVFKQILAEGIEQIYHNRLRSFLTVLGIILGVSSLIVMFSIINAGKKRSMDWMKRWINKVSVNYRPLSRMSKEEKTHSKIFGITYFDYEALKASGIKDIYDITPVQSSWDKVKYGDSEIETQITGSINAYLTDEEFELAQGRCFTSDDHEYAEKVCLIGHTILQKVFKSQYPVDKYLKIGSENYRVIGVLKEYIVPGRGNQRWGEWRNSRVVIPIQTMMYRVKGDKVIELSYRIKEISDSETINENVKEILLRRRGYEDFTLDSNTQNILEFQKTQNMWNAILALIAIVSLVVSGIGITNIMLATMKDRIKEIGLKKSLGATSGNIKLQFLMESSLLSLMGGLAGVLIGSVFSFFAQKSIDMEVAVNIPIILLALLFAIAVGVISGFYPAVKASNIVPVEALRYE